MFAWTPSDTLGVPREVIEHHLAVCPHAHPVKQKTRKQAQEKQDFIVQEIEKPKKAKLIREVAHPLGLQIWWLSQRLMAVGASAWTSPVLTKPVPRILIHSRG
jgi:hypothetical protein